MPAWRHPESGESRRTAAALPECGILLVIMTTKLSANRVRRTYLGGGRLPLARPACVAVVTGGAGTVNGVAVQKGDRLGVADEAAVDVAGAAEVVVCV